MTTRRLLIVGFIVAILIAVVAAQFASSSPDGLEYVAEQEGFIDAAQNHALADSPLADYGKGLTGSSWVDTAVAGLAGTVVTLGLAYGVFRLARRRDGAAHG